MTKSMAKGYKLLNEKHLSGSFLKHSCKQAIADKAGVIGTQAAGAPWAGEWLIGSGLVH
ncbi:MAG: hypothetical protein KKA75_04095 [Proteobacteria bacterium]|nr:hypothetical protein [Pseudomonadota bacterium]